MQGNLTNERLISMVSDMFALYLMSNNIDIDDSMAIKIQQTLAHTEILIQSMDLERRETFVESVRRMTTQLECNYEITQRLGAIRFVG